jgi:hypothetical protein
MGKQFSIMLAFNKIANTKKTIQNEKVKSE